MDFEIREYTQYDAREILPLYESVGWTSYTQNPQMLERAFHGSRYILAAYDGSRLVGLIRTVGDGASILYIQDLLVHPDFQNQGIGKTLLGTVMEQNRHVYQKCLMTDDSARSVGFYEKMGFMLDADYGARGLVKIY